VLLDLDPDAVVFARSGDALVIRNTATGRGPDRRPVLPERVASARNAPERGLVASR